MLRVILIAFSSLRTTAMSNLKNGINAAAESLKVSQSAVYHAIRRGSVVSASPPAGVVYKITLIMVRDHFREVVMEMAISLIILFPIFFFTSRLPLFIVNPNQVLGSTFVLMY